MESTQPPGSLKAGSLYCCSRDLRYHLLHTGLERLIRAPNFDSFSCICPASSYQSPKGTASGHPNPTKASQPAHFSLTHSFCCHKDPSLLGFCCFTWQSPPESGALSPVPSLPGGLFSSLLSRFSFTFLFSLASCPPLTDSFVSLSSRNLSTVIEREGRMPRASWSFPSRSHHF